MSRNQVIIKFPTLNDKGGDCSKKWYVEYYYRIPGETEPRRRRISEGLCKGTAAERYMAAQQIISRVTKMLKSPDLFIIKPDEITKVLADDTHTRPEADRYAAYEQAIQGDNLTKEYVDYLDGSVAQKTHETYRSKLRIFNEWCKQTQTPVVSCTQEQIIPFFQWLAKERDLTKRSIFKYKQILHSFYEWLIKHGYTMLNPVYEIPNYGKIVDMAPAPIEKSDIEKLKETIRKNDPQLWLACMIQYYCAIRPGTELRLLKVGDIHLQTETITIRQENAKNRHKETVPLPTQVKKMIEKLGYMNYPASFYLFGTYGVPATEPMGKNTLRNRFNQYRDDLGLDKSIKFYSWKHTGAVTMVENGVSVWDLQHHMRHSSISTTEEYIRQRANRSKRAKDFLDDI